MDKRPALGKGLSALIPDAPPAVSPGPLQVDIDLLSPNQQQPRHQMDDARLDELARSIQTRGIIQPILVRPSASGGYSIIAGERRWRAAQRAGLLKVPVVVRDVPEDATQQQLELALIENIQRENLNAIEESLGYQRLTDEFGLTQEQIAAAVGKDRSTVANLLRLLRLVISRSLSVRETEALVKRMLTPARSAAASAAAVPADVHTRAAEERMRFALGAKVSIVRRGTGGTIEIAFGSEAELNRIFETITAKG